MSTYINTIERYYKISIDNYAVVNFASFPKIIDALGGVEVNITTAEINEINNNPYVYGDVGDVWIDKTFDGDEGTMLLDGIQALAFCRIRHIDSDNARADRQKTVITEIISKMKSSGTVDTVKVVNQLSQYTKTGYTKKELISIGNLALRDGWLDFDMQTTTVPTTDNSAGGQTFSVARGTWIWLSDIPLDAYNLQMTIYGKSNIQLNENRPDYISMGR
jgi:LCP family protein required for cell wall assembly